MRIYCTEDYASMSRKAANLLSAQVILKPESILGLATGSTPVGIYRQLAAWYRKGDLSFSQVRTVNLDEYVGLPASHPQSYHDFMQQNLFKDVDIDPASTYLPNGMAENLEEECCRYESLIRSLGPVDMQLLGMGRNGHIGFNEPSDDFPMFAHVVELAESTIQANARFFADPGQVPQRALTMGVGDIMRARQVLLVVSGSDKAEAVYRAFAGPITPQVPASVLQLHPEVTLVGDKAALNRLLKTGMTVCS
ncbi:MAG: glucosamine-6-phosphate deaminase [Oscillospiraceae bacterium]|nr:glucosamine-6-phosphate deaminase [Oscillospiraceae bacterium]